MTSLRQIESNRRNAQRSTGPKTQSGKARSSQNAVRHGLTAETVIGPLEDPADYQAFEQAVTTGYDAETAVERELVLRLASEIREVDGILTPYCGRQSRLTSFRSRQAITRTPRGCAAGPGRVRIESVEG